MLIKLSGVIPESFVDGPGIRFTIFTQGCPHRCEGCHNPETHEFNAGHEFDIEEVKEWIRELEFQKGVTFSGGDPMFQAKQCAILAKVVHELGMNVWAYTGFTYEQLIDHGNPDILEFLSEVDVLIDGKFDINKRSLDLEFRGSSNQRVIDVPKSLENHKVTLFDFNKSKESQKKKEVLYI